MELSVSRYTVNFCLQDHQDSHCDCCYEDDLTLMQLCTDSSGVVIITFVVFIITKSGVHCQQTVVHAIIINFNTIASVTMVIWCFNAIFVLNYNNGTEQFQRYFWSRCITQNHVEIHLNGFKLFVARQRCNNVVSFIRDTASHFYH